MAKPDKLRCDSCGKEALEEDTTEWIKKLIQGKDFCSKKCVSKYIKKNYDESDVEVVPEETVTPQAVVPNVDKDTTDSVWEVKNIPTQYAQAIQNKETGETLEVLPAVAKILDRLDEVLKRL